MSSSSPKYGKESMLVDCLKAMHCKPLVIGNISYPKQDLANLQSQQANEREVSYPVIG